MQLNIGLRVAPVAVSAIPPAFANSLTAKVLQKALGSTPNGCAKIFRGVAQLVEWVVWDHQVARSSRVTPTKKLSSTFYGYAKRKYVF